MSLEEFDYIGPIPAQGQIRRQVRSPEPSREGGQGMSDFIPYTVILEVGSIDTYVAFSKCFY